MQCDIKIDFSIEIRDLIMLSNKITALISNKVYISKNNDNRHADFHSTLGLLSLDLEQGDTVNINVLCGSERDMGVIKDLFNEIKNK